MTYIAPGLKKNQGASYVQSI